MKAKLLFVINSLGGGGAQKLINDMLPFFQKDGYVCDLLILTNNEDKYRSNLESNNISVIVVPPNIKGHFNKIKYIKKIIITNGYDIVHANLFPSFYYCSMAIKLIRKKRPKLIMTEHNTDNRRRHKKWARFLERWIYKSYYKIISISQETNNALVEWLKPYKKESFIVINNGVPVQQFATAIETERTKLDKNLSKEDVLICMVGSFTTQKNHDLALKILSKLPENYKLVCLGEGPLKEEIIDKAKQMGIFNRIVMLGFRKDVPNVLKACDLMLIPSKWEGFGLVAVEAMACGLPVIASDVPGLSEVVGNGGFLCNKADETEFVNSIKLLSDANTYDSISKSAIKRSQLFDISMMICSYEELFESIVKND